MDLQEISSFFAIKQGLESNPRIFGSSIWCTWNTGHAPLQFICSRFSVCVRVHFGPDKDSRTQKGRLWQMGRYGQELWYCTGSCTRCSTPVVLTGTGVYQSPYEPWIGAKREYFERECGHKCLCGVSLATLDHLHEGPVGRRSTVISTDSRACLNQQSQSLDRRLKTSVGVFAPCPTRLTAHQSLLLRATGNSTSCRLTVC